MHHHRTSPQKIKAKVSQSHEYPNLNKCAVMVVSKNPTIRIILQPFRHRYYQFERPLSHGARLILGLLSRPIIQSQSLKCKIPSRLFRFSFGEGYSGFQMTEAHPLQFLASKYVASCQTTIKLPLLTWAFYGTRILLPSKHFHARFNLPELTKDQTLGRAIPGLNPPADTNPQEPPRLL